MADHGDKSTLKFLSLAEMGDVSGRGNDIRQTAVLRQQRGVGHAHREGRAVHAHQIPFHVEGGLRSQRPAACLGFLQRRSVIGLGKLDDLIMVFSHQVLDGCPDHAGKGRVDTLDGVIGFQDKDTVGHRIKQGGHFFLFPDALSIKLRITDRHRGLVGKTLQQGSIVGREHPAVVAEDENHPDHLVAGDQRQANTGHQAQADLFRQLLEDFVNFGEFKAGRVFMVGHSSKQRLQMLQQLSRNAVRGCQPPAAIRAAQRNQARVSR